MPQRTLTLKPGTWSQEILSEFALGTDGVYLELSMDSARRHAQQLCGTKNNIALITTQALDLFKHQQRATFVLLERTEQGVERDKVVTGFIHSFGKQPVKYLDDTQTMVSKLIPRATVVLRARMRRSTCEKKDWDDMGKCSLPHQIRQYLENARPDLKVNDVFRIENDSVSKTWMMRVSQSQLRSWLIADGLPFCVLPVGPEMDGFRIIWDREADNLKKVRTKFESLPGFAGPVLTDKGCGARFDEKFIDQARQQAGLACGEVYWVSGVPVEFEPQDLPTLLAELGWTVTLLQGGRRIKGNIAHYKVRAAQRPPREIFRVRQANEILTMHVKEAANVVKKPTKDKSDPGNDTWAQVIKNSLGRETAEVVEKTDKASKPSRKHPREPTPDDDEYWDNLNVFDDIWEEGEQESDSDMDDSLDQGQGDNLENSQENSCWSRHVRIEDDSYVEEAPPAKLRKKKSQKSKFAPTPSRRLKVLEESMTGLQNQFQQLTQALMSGGVSGQIPTPVPRALKGQIPWPQGVELPKRQTPPAPGDGNCLWHSAAANVDNDRGSPCEVWVGEALKSEVLKQLETEPEKWARLWRCNQQGVVGAAEEWKTQWADARACLTLSLLHDCTIVIFNRRDKLIETIHAGDSQPYSRRTWYMDYTGDHYDPLPRIGDSDLQQIAQHTQFQDWAQRTGGLNSGGFVPVMRLGPAQKRRRLLKRHKPMAKQTRQIKNRKKKKT